MKNTSPWAERAVSRLLCAFMALVMALAIGFGQVAPSFAQAIDPVARGLAARANTSATTTSRYAWRNEQWCPLGWRWGPPGNATVFETATNSQNGRFYFWTPKGSGVRALRAVYARYGTSDPSWETSRGVDIDNLKTSLIYGSVAYPFYTNGQLIMPLLGGRGVQRSDPLSFDIPADTQFKIANFLTWGATATITTNGTTTITVTTSPSAGSGRLRAGQAITSAGNIAASTTLVKQLTSTSASNPDQGDWQISQAATSTASGQTATTVSGAMRFSIVTGLENGSDPNRYLSGEGSQRSNAETDLSADGTTSVSNLGGGYYPPLAIEALLVKPQPCIEIGGDSILSGANDTLDAKGYGSYGERSLSNTLPWFRDSMGGTSAQQVVARMDGINATVLSSGITDSVLGWGRNDIFSSSRTAAQLKADIATIAAPRIRAGIRVWVTTIPPYTSGTYTSSAGQTIVSSTNEAQRVIYNADIRANYAAYGYAGVIDMAAQLEDASNPGKWANSGGLALTNDGVHPNTRGHDLLVASGVMAPARFLTAAGLQ